MTHDISQLISQIVDIQGYNLYKIKCTYKCQNETKTKNNLL